MLAGDILNPKHDNIAIAFEDGEDYTHADLDILANRFANTFKKLELEPGDRVSFLMGNDPLLIGGYFGAFRAGLIANPLNNRLLPAELAYVLNHAGSRLIVVSGEFTESLDATLPLLNTKPKILVIRSEEIPQYATCNETDLRAATDTPPSSSGISGDDGALLIYTSGTTANPKGVLLTHDNILAGVDYVKAGFEIGPSDRTLCVMPLFHTNGLMFSTLPFLMAGATIVLRYRFSASRLWQQCLDNRANSFSASPTILALLLKHEAGAPPAAEIDLKYVKVASAPTSVALATQFEARFGKGLLLETFGLTETTAITTMNPLHGTRKFGSIGYALAPQEVRIVDTAGSPLPAGEVGEIQIRGATVMKEYFRDPDNTVKAVHDGWLCTGDLARMDDDGYIYMVGRAKEMIVRGGENISPLEIEAAVIRHPSVIEAAVVGLPDQTWGEVVALCVVASAPLDETELLDHCRANLTDFKVPQIIKFVDDLPKNAMGKVTRRKLDKFFQ